MGAHNWLFWVEITGSKKVWLQAVKRNWERFPCSRPYSTVLAIAVNIQIMRTFVRLRATLDSSKRLARRFARLEARLDKKLAKHDESISDILSAIRQLMESPTSKQRGIGFTADLGEKA